VFCSTLGFAGVSRPIQERYRRNYENKALFLKVPIFAERQHIFITGNSARPEPPPAGVPARFKVGDQVRVLGIDFSGDEIRFKLGAISGTGSATLVFKFDAELADSFPNSAAFDGALDGAFTEGMKFSDVDEAKRGYVEDQFERVLRDLVTTSGTSREFVLKSMAAKLPGYQEPEGKEPGAFGPARPGAIGQPPSRDRGPAAAGRNQPAAQQHGRAPGKDRQLLVPARAPR
ncbi:MAG: hypothetical protein DMG07_26510, partial [Acidobacteria bacterium]